MRKTETLERPASTYERVIETECDICHKTNTGDGWEQRGYDVEEVTISYETGARYPDSANVMEYSFDICPQCWKDHIVKFFAQMFNIKPRVQDRGY